MWYADDPMSDGHDTWTLTNEPVSLHLHIVDPFYLKGYYAKTMLNLRIMIGSKLGLETDIYQKKQIFVRFAERLERREWPKRGTISHFIFFCK